MGAELLFESRLTNHVLRQEGTVESEPYLALRLALTDGPIIYASDGTVVQPLAWRLKIRRRAPGAVPATQHAGTMSYIATDSKPHCIIELEQSVERFAALLEMFKGGIASEITVVVADLADKPDYSKGWNTALQPSIAIQSICFEFPLPQTEE